MNSETYGLIEQRHLRGNAVLKRGNVRYRVASNETNGGFPTSFLLGIKTQCATDARSLHYDFVVISTDIVSIEDPTYLKSTFFSQACIGFIPPIAQEPQILKDSRFEIKLWKTFTEMTYEGREGAALVYLFETLHDNLDNVERCNAFVKYSIRLQMNPDVIVHIFNALSPIKSKLKYWEEFTEYSIAILEKEVGKDITKLLLKTIV